MKRSLVACLLLAGSPAMCAILYETGFEQPAYQLGDLASQQGWNTVQFPGEPAPLVTVQSQTVATGSQALGVTKAQNSQSGAAREIFYNAEPFQQDIVMVTANVYFSDGQSLSGWQFALNAPQLGAGIAGINVGHDRKLRLVSGDSRETGHTFGRDRWVPVRFDLDFSMQTFDVYVDGQQIDAGVPFYTTQMVLGTIVFNTFSAANPLLSDDQGFLDDLRIQTLREDTVPTPEPASLLMMTAGLGALATIRRRRRRR